MIDYHYPIYKFKPRSIFPNLVTHFPTVDKQKKSRAKARGYIEKISPQKKKKKKKGKGKNVLALWTCFFLWKMEMVIVLGIAVSIK